MFDLPRQRSWRRTEFDRWPLARHSVPISLNALVRLAAANTVSTGGAARAASGSSRTRRKNSLIIAASLQIDLLPEETGALATPREHPNSGGAGKGTHERSRPTPSERRRLTPQALK